MRQPQQPGDTLNTFHQKSKNVQDDYSQIRTKLSTVLGLMDKLIEKDNLSNEHDNNAPLNNRPSLR